MPENDGGPAFPISVSDGAYNENTNEWVPSIPVHPGMSLRDWFAGQALVGAVDRMNLLRERAHLHDHRIAARVYELADAVIAHTQSPQPIEEPEVEQEA